MALVGVVMGSKTDSELIQPALDMFKQLGIAYELSVISAHRNPEKVREYGLQAEKRGLKVIIAAAGKASTPSSSPLGRGTPTTGKVVQLAITPGR